MATSRAIPDGGLGTTDIQVRRAPKVSARKKAASEAVAAQTPRKGLPRSKSSVKAEKGAMGLTKPKNKMPSSKAPAKAGKGASENNNFGLPVPPSQDSAGLDVADAHSDFARSGDGHLTSDTPLSAAVSDDSASRSYCDAQMSTARSKGGRRALLEDPSGQAVRGAQSPPAGEGGHYKTDTPFVGAAQDLAGQPRLDAQITVACEGEGHRRFDTHTLGALSELLSDIKTRHRFRQDYQRARTRLDLQLLAICCRSYGYSTLAEETSRKKAIAAGSALLKKAKKGEAEEELQGVLDPMLAAHKLIAHSEKKQTKKLEEATDGLPAAVLAWTDGIRGFGRLGLAQILGETGDLSLYSNPGKVWKRMGLAVFDGKSQRKCTDKAKAEEQGYAPSRRSIMHVIGVSLICQNKDYLRQVYDAEKLRQEQLYPHLTVGHRDKKARRYMQKRLLRELWREWRAATISTTPRDLLPPCQPSGNGEGHRRGDTQFSSASPIPEPEAA